jgi:hypothetical protein
MQYKPPQKAEKPICSVPILLKSARRSCKPTDDPKLPKNPKSGERPSAFQRLHKIQPVLWQSCCCPFRLIRQLNSRFHAEAGL